MPAPPRQFSAMTASRVIRKYGAGARISREAQRVLIFRGSCRRDLAGVTADPPRRGSQVSPQEVAHDVVPRPRKGRTRRPFHTPGSAVCRRELTVHVKWPSGATRELQTAICDNSCDSCRNLFGLAGHNKTQETQEGSRIARWAVRPFSACHGSGSIWKSWCPYQIGLYLHRPGPVVI